MIDTKRTEWKVTWTKVWSDGTETPKEHIFMHKATANAYIRDIKKMAGWKDIKIEPVSR